MRISAASTIQNIARQRWFFLLHAIFMILLGFLLLSLHWLSRNLLIGTFAGIFALMITGFFVLIVGLVDAGAALNAFLDNEAVGWLLVLLAAAGIFVGILVLVSPTISIERLCFFVSIHALALGFLEVRLSQRLRGHKPRFPRKEDALRGFAAASTTFFLLLLLPALYGERFGILMLAAYCFFFAFELILLPSRLSDPDPQPSF